MTLTHVDLFSGIGGFSLAAGWAGFETVLHCEIDPFCQRVLAKHWPEVKIHDDIRTLTTDLVPAGTVTLLTGGFPCQPWSIAGDRRGTADDRHLWPEMCRVISEVRPRFVCAENVGNFVSMGLDAVRSDLETIGYKTGSLEIPACAIGTDHVRMRVFILAHASCAGLEGIHAPCDREHLQLPQGALPRYERQATPRVLRAGHGIPNALDRLRALGNAVVPQQVYPILAAIAEYEQKQEGCPSV